ncbi:hypothetical protein BGZ83_005021, partial [Gryganskiella cystojenkinii]
MPPKRRLDKRRAVQATPYERLKQYAEFFKDPEGVGAILNGSWVCNGAPSGGNAFRGFQLEFGGSNGGISDENRPIVVHAAVMLRDAINAKIAEDPDKAFRIGLGREAKIFKDTAAAISAAQP